MVVKIPAAVTFVLPSKLTFQARSPVIAIFLEFSNLVAVSALPVTAPSNSLAYTLRQ